MIKYGRSNKGPSQIITYPGYGFVKNDQWRLLITGIAFTNPAEFNMRKRFVIHMLRNAMDVTPEQTDCDVFRSRVAPFMADGGKRLRIRIEIGSRYRVSRKTKSSGRFSTLIKLTKNEIENATEITASGKRIIRYRVSTDLPDSIPAEGMVHLFKEQGISIISDIDDTIKVTSVADKRELLFNTFLREFKSVDGMAALYRKWSDAGADFHYVSSSPWQLFDPLFEMQQRDGFPDGTLHLRNYKISDQILKRVPVFRSRGKTAAIRRLMKHLPQRKFILIGDSGEKDPEIYRKACRRRPGQVAGVFIRNLSDKPLNDLRIQKLNRNPELVDCVCYSDSGHLDELATGLIGAASVK